MSRPLYVIEHWAVAESDARRLLFPGPLKTLNGNQQGWEIPNSATMLAHGDPELSPKQALPSATAPSACSSILR